ncbi:ATP-binding protein [Microbacterium sp. RU33B]|uniref:ATP-binding protein n=1 Tax=Microbacterium sp. RU33B TaxID=1907390 RepID=UPI000976B544|nr:ATP-binding protein [Microbacterium sp. RU33B]
MTTAAPSVATADAARAASRPPLLRPRECAVSGTAEGLADHLGWRPLTVRVALAVLCLLWGAGVLLYLWLWALTPWRPGPDAPSRRVPVAWVLTAAASVAGFTTVLWVSAWGGPYSGPSAWVVACSATSVLGIVAGSWATLVDTRDPARGPRHALAVRLTVTGILVVVLVVLLAVAGSSSAGLFGLVMSLGVLISIALVHATTLLAKWRELSGERVRRIREEQRSEMAAHLHDSVLQTLALIQNRAGASSEVARIARAQERELRSWLYDGDAPADSDLPTDLRDFAGALELDYPVRIDVVSAGSSTERASGDVAAAAREAMLNAARHAGGEVSVYIEGSPAGVDVFVRDRGAGFDLTVVPGDRLGVRESIIGRMRRAGGSATVRPTATGTEVHLRLDAEVRRG